MYHEQGWKYWDDKSMMLQYTRSIYQKSGIAQSAYVAQGFSPVTFATGTDSTMGTVEKKEVWLIDCMAILGHMTTPVSRKGFAFTDHTELFLQLDEEYNYYFIGSCVRTIFWLDASRIQLPHLSFWYSAPIWTDSRLIRKHDTWFGEDSQWNGIGTK